MEITYRRRQPVSRLERLLARLVREPRQPTRPTIRIDLVLDADGNFRQV